ncbi:MAG: DUF4271 domain-containing protein [Bacteroidetes bacterium]|nr:DUF4271 domain-containing protein [Bacteroidota bacterium]
MKYLLIILLFSILQVSAFSQDTQKLHKPADSTLITKPVNHKDTTKKDTTHRKPVTIKQVKFDSLSGDTIYKDSLLRDSLGNIIAPVVHDSSITIQDSMRLDSLKKDSIKKAVRKPIPQKPAIQLMPGAERNIPDKDILFYILLFLIFFLGLVKTAFPKYVNSIFTLSFQASFRQTQTREQMSQNFFPAFMLNILFVLCGGLFITQFATFNQWSKLPFWQLFIYSTAILLIIYVIKYLVIIFTGWIFNAKEAATEYRFVVFLINKILGIVVIPLLFIIAYSNTDVQNVSVTIVVCLAVFSLVVRYIVSLARIRKNLSVTAFHFFIYLCAVEIMPLLVIYKVLFLQASNR